MFGGGKLFGIRREGAWEDQQLDALGNALQVAGKVVFDGGAQACKPRHDVAQKVVGVVVVGAEQPEALLVNHHGDFGNGVARDLV